MLRGFFAQRFVLSIFAVVLLLATVLAYSLCAHCGAPNLPFYANSTDMLKGKWKAYGGTWDFADGSWRNESTERGAKLITGGSGWSNYDMDADLQLLGPGDAGLLVRVTKPELGVDSYSGYYIGLRTLDNTLVAGRASHSWQQYPAISMAESVKPFEWYHLHVTAVGCRIEAKATSRRTGQSSFLSLIVDRCYKTGQVGLRSYSAGGVWRNVSVTAAMDRPAQLPQQAATTLPVSDHLLLARNIRGSYLKMARRSDEAAVFGTSTLPPKPISNLRLLVSGQHSLVSVRGVVILSMPHLFIQDATGGVAVSQLHGPPLRIGDEVEVQGNVETSGLYSALHNATVRLLWEGEPPPPYSVTLNQAAGGAYDSTFVEMEALLKQKRRGPKEMLVLDMEGRSQSFQAILNSARSSALFHSLNTGSTLRLRGICVVDPQYTRNVNPFALLVRSVEDLQVVNGPPWWSWYSLLRVCVAMIVLALFAYILYLRVRNWRMCAVLEERGRLAHEIHDTLAQSFAGIGFQLQAIRKRISPEDLELGEQLALACVLVNHSHEETRRSISTLRSTPSTAFTLIESLRECAFKMVGNGPLAVDVTTSGQPCLLPLQIESALLRIGQEATANAVRHSSASRVSIWIGYGPETISLRVEDNGRGFSPGDTGGFGLPGIRRRVSSIGAAVRIESEPDCGTRVEVVAPFARRKPWAGLLWRRNNSSSFTL